MNAQVAVSVRSLTVTGLVILAFVLTYLLGGASGSAPAQAEDDEGSPDAGTRTLTINGTGRASAVPDELSFSLTVKVVRTDLDQALASANATTSRVLESLEGFDVAKDDVQTTGLSMNPVYDYHESSPPTIRGYRVSQRASVLVGDLKQGGAAVGAAVAAGGNDVRVANIRLLVGDPVQVEADARDAAVAEATAKAEQYAAAAGQVLGQVVTLREVQSQLLPTPASYAAQDAVRAELSDVPIRAGREQTTVTVQLVWQLG